MKVLITGGLGHIGSYLIRNLWIKNSGIDICIVDNLSTQRFGSLFNIDNRKVKVIFSDLRNLSMEDKNRIGRVDVVIHLAALTDAAGTASEPKRVFDNNFDATKRIVEFCSTQNALLIFPSSTSVYGSQSKEVDEGCLFLNPQSPYAESKILEEQEVKKYIKHGGKAFILRLGTICGTSAGMRFHTAVNKFCLQAALGEKLEVWRTALNQVRPYLSLEDTNRGIQFILNNQTIPADTYNFVSQNCTVSQIIRLIESQLGKPVQIEFVDNLIMNQLSYAVSNEKFSSHGFNFSGTIEREVRNTVNLLRGILPYE